MRSRGTLRVSRVLKPTPESIAAVATALARGEVAAIPTETVYGLAGNALDEKALSLIFKVKNRPTFDPLIVHFGVQAKNPGYLIDEGFLDKARMQPLLPVFKTLTDKFWPGPLTLVLPKSPKIPDLATAGMSTVAVRIPSHPVALSLLAQTSFPLAAPSANPFGKTSPTEASHVARDFGPEVPWILDGGRCQVGLESTVVWIESPARLHLLRPGKISAEDIRTLIPQAVIETAPDNHPSRAPGLLASHYAPAHPVVLITKNLQAMGPSELAKWIMELTKSRRLPLQFAASLIWYSKPNDSFKASLLSSGVSKVTAESSLTPTTNDDRTASQNLFSELRRHGELPGVDLILAEPPHDPKTGLEFAILDRLTRASAQRSV